MDHNLLFGLTLIFFYWAINTSGCVIRLFLSIISERSEWIWVLYYLFERFIQFKPQRPHVFPQTFCFGRYFLLK
ncbi:hypothetical protein LDENG_00065710 [Lucifuga dentata]|nr:hypothetical protein LDENG_00065710 [Lucifuga dentata]